MFLSHRTWSAPLSHPINDTLYLAYTFIMASSKGQDQIIYMGNNFQGSTNFIQPREPEILCYISIRWQRGLLSLCSCHIIFLCLRQKPQGRLQGLLFTWNNSRDYGFPPLPNLTTGSSPGNRVKLGTEHTKQDEQSAIPWNFWLATWGTWKCLSEEGK